MGTWDNKNSRLHDTMPYSPALNISNMNECHENDKSEEYCKAKHWINTAYEGG